jgi:hypothetical protein
MLKDEQGRPFIVVREYVHRYILLSAPGTTIGPSDMWEVGADRVNLF